MEEMDVRKLLAGNIVRYRRALGYSQNDLFSHSELSLSFIASMETCAKFPSAKTLAQLAKALHVEVYQLFLPAEKSDEEMKSYFELGFLREQVEKSVLDTISSAFREHYRSGKEGAEEGSGNE